MERGGDYSYGNEVQYTTKEQNGVRISNSYRSIHTSPKALGVTVLTHSRAIVLEYSTVAWRQDHISALGHTPALVHKVPTAITLGVIGSPARGVGDALGVAHRASRNCDGGEVEEEEGEGEEEEEEGRGRRRRRRGEEGEGEEEEEEGEEGEEEEEGGGGGATVMVGRH